LAKSAIYDELKLVSYERVTKTALDGVFRIL